MLRLTTVFADHALFQHSAPLTVRGTAEGKVRVLIKRGEAVLSSGEGDIGADGRFAVCLTTPPASFDPCTVHVTSGDDSVVLTDVLFGELWIAGGQSNMELPNEEHPDYDLRRPGFIAAGVRAYHAYQFPFDDPMPREPEFFGEGDWFRAEDERFREVAALPSIFCQRVSEALGVPVGFLNVNRGCTRIETWIPARMMDEELRDYLIKTDRLPTDENWNTFGDRTRYIDKNFQQFSSYYNRAVAPLAGVSVRGILWYQGGSNRSEHCKHGYYPTLLDTLRRAWREDLGIPGAEFPMYLSALYPYGAGEITVDDGVFVGDLVRLAESRPGEYYVLPISDHSPAWAVFSKNHPVHPVNKYHQGERFARLVLDTFYRTEGEGTLPATLAEVTRGDGAITLRFRNVGTGLYVKGEAPHGLYIADGEGHYLPAIEYEILSPDTLRLSHPGIPDPQEAAYDVRMGEVECNLFAGAYPVLPFFTAPHDTWRGIRIEKRPWCELTMDGDLHFNDDVDAYRRAIFAPLTGSGYCYDRDYTLGPRSLRIYTDEGDGKEFGVRINSYNGARLDFGHYRALRMGVFPMRALVAELHLIVNGEEVVIPASEPKPLATPAWGEIEFSLADIQPGATVSAMEWRFRRTEGVAFGVVNSAKEANGINLDRIYLVP